MFCSRPDLQFFGEFIGLDRELIEYFVAGLDLIQRNTIVAIPSRGRNSFSPLQPRPAASSSITQKRTEQNHRRGGPAHVLGYRKRKPEKLKSGIYYVDDPHASFRDETEKAQDRISGR